MSPGRDLRIDEISSIVEQFRSAARRAVDAGMVGVRISPGSGVGDMRENDPVGTYEALLTRIAGLEIAYLHVLIDLSTQTFGALRALWSGALVLNAGHDDVTDFDRLEGLVSGGAAGAVAVGRSFLANPDLIDRLVLGAPLNEPDPGTFCASGPAGYIDYPTLADVAEARSA